MNLSNKRFDLNVIIASWTRKLKSFEPRTVLTHELNFGEDSQLKIYLVRLFKFLFPQIQKNYWERDGEKKRTKFSIVITQREYICKHICNNRLGIFESWGKGGGIFQDYGHIIPPPHLPQKFWSKQTDTAVHNDSHGKIFYYNLLRLASREFNQPQTYE